MRVRTFRDFVQDHVRVLGPDEAAWGLVVMSEVPFNRGDEGWHALEGAPTNAVARDLAEPPFDEVQPRTAGRNEMKVHPRMTTQPPVDGWALVRAQVVQDHMDGVVSRRGLLDAVEKPDTFLGVALGPARAEHGPIEHAQGGVQAGGGG